MSSIVVVAQNKRILTNTLSLGLFNIAHAMEVFSNLALCDLVLLILLVLGFHVEMFRSELLIRANVFVSLHVQRNRQDALQREVRVLDVLAVNFFVNIKQVGIFEFFNWLVRNLRNPIVHAQATIFQNDFL